eukprot:27317_1
MSSSTQTEALSEQAQQLLEQYKNYREDGIVEIKEPISSAQESQSEFKNDTQRKATEIAQKIMDKSKPKHSVIINKLPSITTKNKRLISDIGGQDSAWWDQMTKDENNFVGDYAHKVNNIALMQKYETLKDPSPFNPDNDMDTQTRWETHLWKESMQKQEAFLDKTQPKPKPKKKKKKVKFASNLITKQATSAPVTEHTNPPTSPIPKEPIKPLKKPKKSPQQTYGNLVGFFNKKRNKKRTKKTKASSNNAQSAATDHNPYLDTKVMKDSAEYTPNQNQRFEQKFDHKKQPNPTVLGSNEFTSMIIPSDEFKTPQPKPKSILKNKAKGFNGCVFERKPPDMVYVSDNAPTTYTKQSNVNPQPLPTITQPKTSLFRKRIEMNDALYEMDDAQATNTQFPAVMSVPNTRSKKKVRFADELVTKQLVIDDTDEAKEDICLLFLDVDGVLNCSYSPPLSKAHVLRLKEILNRTTNCKICISSSWRVYVRTRLQLIHGLKDLGGIEIEKVVIGDTPRIHKDPLRCRPEEIQSYLQKNEYLNENYNVLRWCAIDDIPLDTVNTQYSEFMKTHFVKTDPRKGLTDRDVDRVVGILNGQTSVDTLDSITEEDMQVQVMEVKGKKEEIKILFLDVDGVLNYEGFDDKGIHGAVSEQHLERLKKIVVESECKIVLSTAWRRIAYAKEQLLCQLSKHIGECVIGDTPVLGSQMKKSVEICQYLESIKGVYDVVSWIAIDDMPLNRMGTKRTKGMFENHFVKTDVNVGLSDENVARAISLLNNI